MGGARPRLRDLRLLVAGMFEWGLSIVVIRRDGQRRRARRRARLFLAMGMASVLQHAALAQPLPARVLTPLMAAEAGLHDQTQRVLLLAPNLDAHAYTELRGALAGLGVRAE